MPHAIPLPELLLRHAIAQLGATTEEELVRRSRTVADEIRAHTAEPAELLELLGTLESTRREQLSTLAELHNLASADPLTGLRHHRPLLDRLSACPVEDTALLAIDVDCFKRVNDTLGHPAGDEMLAALADALRRALRPQDEIYRVGGDEFLVLARIPDTGTADKLGRCLGDAARQVGLTISVGIALGAPPEPVTALRHRADAALYSAKHAGRDTVYFAEA